MKSSEEIKKELHEYIDSIADEQTLFALHEDVLDYLKKEKHESVEEEEELSEEELSEIKTGTDQIEKGETVNWEEYQKATTRWRTK